MDDSCRCKTCKYFTLLPSRQDIGSCTKLGNLFSVTFGCRAYRTQDPVTEKSEVENRVEALRYWKSQLESSSGRPNDYETFNGLLAVMRYLLEKEKV